MSKQTVTDKALTTALIRLETLCETTKKYVVVERADVLALIEAVKAMREEKGNPAAASRSNGRLFE